MKFWHYVVSRLLTFIPVFLGITILVFFLARVMPGDPARLALGPHATSEQVTEFNEHWGLKEPLPIQYLLFMNGLIHGDLGRSFETYRPVVVDIAEFFPPTLELVLYSFAFTVVVSILLGVISSVKRNKWPDYLSRLLAVFGSAAPSFWLAIVLQLIFAVGLLQILPPTGRLSTNLVPPPRITGMLTVDSLMGGNWNAFIDAIRHLILPVLALSLMDTVQMARVIRSGMIDESQKDYVYAARAHGLPENLIVYNYELKNAFRASLTLLGLSFGYALGGTFIIEYVFGWPGLGRFAVESMLHKDLNPVVGIVVVVGFLRCIVNFVVDLLYGYLDPRIRGTK